MNKLTIPYLQQLCGDARFWFDTEQLIISGGAPRDILSDVPVKDIDIFLRVSDDDAMLNIGDDSTFRQRCRNFAGVFDGEAEFVTHDRQSDSARVLDYACVRNALLGHSIDIVALGSDPIDDVHNYDFGLSQVFVTPRGYFETPRAQYDRRYGIITYRRDIGTEIPASIQNSKRRVARLREKYTHSIGWEFDCAVLDAVPFVEDKVPE